MIPYRNQKVFFHSFFSFFFSLSLAIFNLHSWDALECLSRTEMNSGKYSQCRKYDQRMQINRYRAIN